MISRRVTVKNTDLAWKSSCREGMYFLLVCTIKGQNTFHSCLIIFFYFFELEKAAFKDRKLSFCHERLFLLTQLVV